MLLSCGQPSDKQKHVIDETTYVSTQTTYVSTQTTYVSTQQKTLAEFHTELELLPVDELKNIYIKHPISLEQFLMEGSFHKVFLSKGNVPAENYNFFIDILIGTIRDEIASCAEKAYTQLSVAEATKMLMCESPQELESYVEDRGWVCEGEFFLFAQEEKKEELHFVRNSLLISQALGYARELEKIV